MVNPNTYFIQSGWMINALKGSELICFAVIYSYSSGDSGKFTGGLNYLASLMGCTHQTASTALGKLVEKGLIVKEEITTETGRRMYYAAVDSKVNEIRYNQLKEWMRKKSALGLGKKSAEGVRANFAPINKDNNSTINSPINSFNENNSLSCNSACAQEKSLLDIEKEEIMRDESWQDTVCMKMHLSREELHAQIEEFFVYCKCSGTDAHNSVNDAKGHFFNRLTQQLNSGKQTIRFRAYDEQADDSEKEAKFKVWMREHHAELENVEKPLSYEEWCALRAEYVEDFGSIAECEACMRQTLDQIDANIGYYRKSNIYAVMRRQFEERRI